MYHLAILATALAVFSGFGARAQETTTLSYDDHYGDARLSLNNVACSDGVNGIETKYPNYTTLGSIPSFPNVGAFSGVSGYNSPVCGTCYAVTYYESTTINTTIHMVAVDKATSGFVVSLAAMNTLTNNQAVNLGRVDVSYVEVPATTCGLPY